MRISLESNVDTSTAIKPTKSTPSDNVIQEGFDFTNTTNEQIQTMGQNDITEEKLTRAVQSMNELLEINQRSSKFVYHKGLDRFYITIVDSETEEVIKEIPPKKLLDGFYEMQKLVGMIIDEKI